MYTHQVQYYETDMMGVTHHSNYLRWMEEARVDYFEKIGRSYKAIEDEGYASPVVSINARYKKSTRFMDIVSIQINLIELSPVKLTFEYIMKVKDTVVFIGESAHCFYNKTGKLLNLQKEKEDLYNLLKDNLKKDDK